MSSSPLPSLSELVIKIPKHTPRDSPAAPPLTHTSAVSIATTSIKNSKKSAQPSLFESDEAFKIARSDSTPSSIGTPKKSLEKKKAPKKTTLKTGDRTAKGSRPKKIKETNLSCAYFGEENKSIGDFVGVKDIPFTEDKKSQEIQFQNTEVISTASTLASEKTENSLNPPKKTARKKAKPKPEKSSQPRLKKGKVTKFSASISPSPKSSETISSMRNILKDVNIIYETDTFRQSQDWTPPTSISNDTTMSPTSQNLDNVPSLDYSNSEVQSKGLAYIIENFGYSKADNSPTKKKSLERRPRKRKLIELVKINASRPGNSRAKKTVLKKKARTLTGLATSAYLEDHGANPPILDEYIQVKNSEETPFSRGFPTESVNVHKSLPGESSCAVQASSLLSPGSAIRQVGTQDFVFGTSSQLAKEDSPTFLRDLHEAMRNSNQCHDPFDSSPTVSTELKDKKKKRNLWNAASRNLDGSLLNVEVVDLAVSPATIDTRPLLPIHEEMLDDICHNPTNSSLVPNIAENTSTVEPIIYQLPSSPPVSPAPSNYLLKKMERPSNNNSLTSNTPSRSSLLSPKTHTMPNFESYTNAQLAKELTKYRFKAVKKRDQMITLLQKCWEGEQRMNLGNLNTCTEKKCSGISSKDSFPKASGFLSPKRTKEKRGHSRSPTALSSKTKAVQITICSGDSENESCNLIPNPKLTKKSRKNLELSGDSRQNQETTKPRTPPLSQSKLRDDSPSSIIELSHPALLPVGSTRSIFDHITQAIKETSPSKEPNNPSWYEKILLFDPIVLEDLTVWLNTGALQKTNWDGEVDLKDVKKWCESKSICCLLRENLKGNARNRY